MSTTSDVTTHQQSTKLSNNKLMMWLFLGSECLLFGAFISTFIFLSSRLPEGEIGKEIFDIPFTSLSSFILLMSSLTMVMSHSAISRGDMRRFRIWITTTALLGGLFIGGQIYEFSAFHDEGLGFTTNVFSSSFFALTGLHGVHVSIGIIMLMTLLIMNLRGGLTKDNAETVEIIGLYWHFVDIVWIVIFTVVYLFP